MTTATRRTFVLNTGDERVVARYLPSNYAVVGKDADGCVVIAGEDSAGWTWEGYVEPRLASGWIFPKDSAR